MKMRTKEEIEKAMAIVGTVLTTETDEQMILHAARAWEILEWVLGKQTIFGDFIDGCDLDSLLSEQKTVTE